MEPGIINRTVIPAPVKFSAPESAKRTEPNNRTDIKIKIMQTTNETILAKYQDSLIN